MNENTANRTCPQCGSPIPTDAPRGLCPKCVLGGVLTATDVAAPANLKELPPLEDVRAAFPQLEVVELIGRGGMGFVYKARQPNLDRFVALKLLWPRLGADPAFAERFNREARVLARLNHPNIVAVYDFGRSGEFFYLLMEFVDGVNLRRAMQAGGFAPSQALVLVPKICEALQFAHEEGILHRDIKPENILLDTKGRVKIADFGIAKLVGRARESLTLTATGAAIGTPHYMAPEQLEHPQDVDQRADIYSLGVVFYEMLTGELPIGRFAPPSEKSAVDPRVDAVVFRTLEREREKRFGSAGEVKTSVENITTPVRQSSTCADPAPEGAVLRSDRPHLPSMARLAAKLAVWTGLLVGIFALVVPFVWSNWWPTIYEERYEIGLRPESGSCPKVTLLAERKLRCWGQNQDRPFSKTDWTGKVLLIPRDINAPAIMELDSRLEQCRWTTPDGQTRITRELPPRSQQALDWMKSVGIDITHPAVPLEAAELVRLVSDAAEGKVPGTVGLRQQSPIVNDKIGPFLVSGGNGWGYTWAGAMFVDQRLVIGVAFLGIWVPGILILAREYRLRLARNHSVSRRSTPRGEAANQNDSATRTTVRPTTEQASQAHEAAVKQVNAAATALFIVGLLNCVPILLFCLAYVTAHAVKNPQSTLALGTMATPILIPLVLGLMSGPIIMVAAQMLKRMVSREFAILACILAAIPPLSPVFLVGIPVSVWCLRVLRRPEVKALFAPESAESGGESLAPSRGESGPGGLSERCNTPISAGPCGTAVAGKAGFDATARDAHKPSVIAPVLPPSGPTRRPWSAKAIAGTVLVALTLGLGAPVGLALSFYMPLLESGNAIGASGKQTLIVAAAIVLGLPGLVGTFLGVVALREVRTGPNQKRGAVAAAFAVLAWPLALLDLVLGRALAWVIFGLVMRVGIPLGLTPASNMAVAAGVALAAIGMIDWLVISWAWRWITCSPALAPRSRLIRIACATAVLGLALIGGVFVSPPRSDPRGTGGSESHFALTPDAAFGPATAEQKRALRWTLGMAPSQHAQVSLTILSNNVEVLTAPLSASLRTAGGKHLTGELVVEVLDEKEEKSAVQPHWRARLVAGDAGQAAFDFTPPVPTAIRWFPIEQSRPILLGRQGSFDGAVLKGEPQQSRGGGPRQFPWSVRLHVEVRPSNLPLSGNAAEVIPGSVLRLPFILSAGQAATFTLVQKDETNQTVFPMLSAYAMAPTGRTLSGEVRWVATGLSATPSPHQTWTTILDTEGGRASSGGLVAPGDWQPAEPAVEPEFVLLPESTTLVKLAVARGQPVASAPSLCVQVVTQPHHLSADLIKRGGGGTGTNWLQAAERLNQFMQ